MRRSQILVKTHFRRFFRNFFYFLQKNLHPSRILTFAALGLISGVILASVLRWNFLASPLWLSVAILLLLFAFLRSNYAFIIVAFLAGMLVAMLRVSSVLSGASEISSLIDQTVTVSGAIASDPKTDDSNISFTLTNLSFSDGENEKAISGTLYVRASKKSAEDLTRDAKITLRGKLSSGFGSFSASLFRPEILGIVASDSPALNFRTWFVARIRSCVPSPAADLGIAYLLGERTGLSEDFDDKLRITGLTFIVVASGAHLSILVSAVRKLFGKLSRLFSLIFSSFLVIFFMAIVGWTPSILRAGFMSLSTLLFSYFGRRAPPLRLILFAMSLTLLIDPTFITNLGWLMSFASYFGITVLGPYLTNFFHGSKKPPWLSANILTSLSATVMVLPISLYYFGTLSLIAPFASLIISPTLAPAMGLTFLSGLTAKIPVLSPLLASVTTLLLNFHIQLIDFLGQTTTFLVQIPAGSPQVFLFYLPILLFLLSRQLRKNVLKLNQGSSLKLTFGGKNMSGHSKWETTKRQKAVVDAKRGALFTKIGNQIAIAARSGTDPDTNPSLAMMLEKARLANMPKANIERAIARVADRSAADLIEETYEAYGPGGVGIIIEVATDNKNRTMPEVRHTLDKNGGRMADPGSVMFQFQRKGVIEIKETGEAALMAALDAGAEDAEEFGTGDGSSEEVAGGQTAEDDSEQGTEIITAPTDLMRVRQNLVDKGLTVTSAELKYIPTNKIELDDETGAKFSKLLDALDDLDDVTAVHTNAA